MMYSSLDLMRSVKPVYSRAGNLLLVLPDMLAYGCWLAMQGQVYLGKSLFLRSATAYILLLLWINLSWMAGLYAPAKLITWKNLRVALLWAIGGQWLLTSLLYLLEIMPMENVYTLLGFCSLLAGFSMGSRCLLMLAYHWRSRTSARQRRFIILGYTAEGKALEEYLMRVGSHHQCLGYFDDHIQATEIKGKLEEVKTFCRKHKVQAIYVCGGDTGEVQDLYRFSDQEYIYFYYLGVGLLSAKKKPQNIYLEEGLSLLRYAPSQSKRLRKKWVRPMMSKPKWATLNS